MQRYVIARPSALVLILAAVTTTTSATGPRVITSGKVSREDAISIVNDPDVKAAIDKAFEDSLPQELEARHEEGGWIIENTDTGKLRVQRCSGGPSGDMFMEVCDANLAPNEQAAAFFHTHPGPEVDENNVRWQIDPSPEDRLAVPAENQSDQFGVVRTQNNYMIYDHTYDQ